jgi:hypothetical protein
MAATNAKTTPTSTLDVVLEASAARVKTTTKLKNCS